MDALASEQQPLFAALSRAQQDRRLLYYGLNLLEGGKSRNVCVWSKEAGQVYAADFQCLWKRRESVWETDPSDKRLSGGGADGRFSPLPGTTTYPADLILHLLWTVWMRASVFDWDISPHDAQQSRFKAEI